MTNDEMVEFRARIVEVTSAIARLVEFSDNRWGMLYAVNNKVYDGCIILHDVIMKEFKRMEQK